MAPHNTHRDGHKHGNHSHQHAHESANIKVAFFLNLSFSIIEIVGGLFTNSVAILSDALHDLGDSFSLALAWYFQKISKKKPNAKYSYGYRRFSLLGALINSIVLLLGSFFVISESIKRIIAPEAAHARGMLFLAIFGILINGLAVLRLRKGSSLNERAVGLHLLEDVLGWIAVLIGSLVMMVWDIPILDPLLSLAIACFILFNIYRNLRDTLRVILQGTPENVNAAYVEKAIRNTKGVESFHDLHLWTMDGEYNILSVHVVVRPSLDKDAIVVLKHNLKQQLKDLNVQHATVEIDQEGEDCGFCESCSGSDI